MQNKSIILKLCGMSESEYSELVFNSAFAYLEDYFPGDTWGQGILSRSSHFWMWWTTQWDRRDGLFIINNGLSSLQENLSREKKHLQELYINHHSISSINCYPSKIVMELSYDLMITEMNKEASQCNSVPSSVNSLLNSE